MSDMPDLDGKTVSEFAEYLRGHDDYDYYLADKCNTAADLIDALKAENERLRAENLLSQPLYSRRQLEERLAAAELKIKELEGKSAEAYEKGWADAMECAADDIRAEAERNY